MYSESQIKEDLFEIRYYYSLQRIFEDNSKFVIPEQLVKKVEKYNAVIGNAPIKQYLVYMLLYAFGKSQVETAKEMKCSREHVRVNIRKLIDYLQKELD